MILRRYRDAGCREVLLEYGHCAVNKYQSSGVFHEARKW